MPQIKFNKIISGVYKLYYKGTNCKPILLYYAIFTVKLQIDCNKDALTFQSYWCKHYACNVCTQLLWNICDSTPKLPGFM